MRIARTFMLATASSALLASTVSAYEDGRVRDRTLVVRAHARDERQQVTDRPVQGATVVAYGRRLLSTVPIFLAEAVTDASGRARLRYESSAVGTFRVLATGPRAEVRPGRVRGERGGLLDLTLGAVTSVDVSSDGFTAVETGETYLARPTPLSLPVSLPRVRYEKAVRFTGQVGTALMIVDVGHRGLTWSHASLGLTNHVGSLGRVTYAHPVTGFDGDIQGTTQSHVAIGLTGPLHPEVVLLALGQVLVRRTLHRQLLTELADANAQDLYEQGRRGTTYASTATAQGLALLLATVMGDALVERDEALLRFEGSGGGVRVVASQGGDRHAGNGLIAPAGLGEARAEFAALGQRSVQNVFCGLWDLVDEADGDTDGVVVGGVDLVDGPRLGGVNRLLADLHEASHELDEGTASLSLQEAWTRRLQARYGAAGAQALRLNGVDVR